MSAGADAELGYELAKPTNELSFLAPGFRAAVERAIAECNNDSNKLDAMVYETYRSSALQAVYFTRGRTVKPPAVPVTNAPNSLYSWHGFGLAVDVIHRTKGWKVGPEWFASVATVFKRYGCKWGGDWQQKDLPHFQWGLCRPSPSDAARELLLTSGIRAVWAQLHVGQV